MKNEAIDEKNAQLDANWSLIEQLRSLWQQPGIMHVSKMKKSEVGGPNWRNLELERANQEDSKVWDYIVAIESWRTEEQIKHEGPNCKYPMIDLDHKKILWGFLGVNWMQVELKKEWNMIRILP